MKKTKIVCTIGPSTDDENIMRELMKNGMDVARFNFSHSDHSVHKARFETVCKLREELGVNIATLLDTKGPEVRLKNFKDHKPVTIKAIHSHLQQEKWRVMKLSALSHSHSFQRTFL